MYLSRFNYVSDFETNGQRLLMNFLSQSADIIDEESARFFLKEKDTLSPEEKKCLFERGYAFQSKDEETALLKSLDETEIRNTRKKYVVFLDTLDEIRNINEISERIQACKKENEMRSVIFYNKRPLYCSIHLNSIITNLPTHCHTNLITTLENLVSFENPLKERQISALTLRATTKDLEDSIPFEKDTELLLDWLIGHNTKVEFVIELRQNCAKKMTTLMNYFIYKGWPFLENFEGTIEPECNEGCLFGHSYSFSDLSKDIFHEYTANPQTEFLTMKKWVGINIIQSLIWTGRLPQPSFHFCEAMNGLNIISADGQTVPCLRMTREPRADLEDFRMIASSRQLDCKDCAYILSCGGGCIHKTEEGVSCPPVKDMIELSIEYYFEEFLRRLAFNENYRGNTV